MQVSTELSVLCALTRQTTALADRLHRIALRLDPDEGVLETLHILNRRVAELTAAVQNREISRWHEQPGLPRFRRPIRRQALSTDPAYAGVPVRQCPPGSAQR